MKRIYDIEFWYNTDLRSTVLVDASNEIAALIMAAERHPSYQNWTGNGPGFFIKIIRR